MPQDNNAYATTASVDKEKKPDTGMQSITDLFLTETFAPIPQADLDFEALSAKLQAHGTVAQDHEARLRKLEAKKITIHHTTTPIDLVRFSFMGVALGMGTAAGALMIVAALNAYNNQTDD